MNLVLYKLPSLRYMSIPLEKGIIFASDPKLHPLEFVNKLPDVNGYVGILGF